MIKSVVYSKAKTTVKKYVVRFRRFVNWADTYKEITTTLLCTELHGDLYLQHLMETTNHFSPVESDFYSIKWVHQMADVPDPCISEVIKNIVEASKRKLCRPIKKKKPITPEEMIQLFKSLNTENRTLKDLRVLAMLAISYTGFLRYNELSNIKANNITFYEDYVNIFIVKSKTDCYRNGKNVVISKLDSLQCPLYILRCYLEEANIEMNTDMYICRALTYI